MKRILSVAWGACLMLAFNTAVAQPSNVDTVARDLLRRGQAAANNGRWQEAYESFRAAWALNQRYVVACNLAQASLELEKFVEAAERARDCLRMLPTDTKPAQRKVASEGYERARSQVGAVRIEVKPRGSEVFLDGKKLGLAPLAEDLFVEPGQHVVKVTYPSRTPAERTVVASKGEVQLVRLELEGAGGAPAGKSNGEHTTGNPGTGKPHDTSRDGVAPRTVALIAGGALTAVAVGLGVGFRLKGSAAHDDAATSLDAATSKFGPAPCSSAQGASSSLCAEVRSKRDEGDSANGISNVSFVAAGVLGVGTAAAFFLWPAESSARAVRATPWTTGNASGITLQGSF